MHRQQRDKLLNILNTAQSLQEKLPGLVDSEARVTVLTSCQQAAISIGETLENSGEDDNGIVHLLEQYCEMIFGLSQLEIIGASDIQDVQLQLEEVRQRLVNFPTKYRVVFLPYKADMWDSLESIWRACEADPTCECDVVPIPYFELNREEKKWEPRYDGARFPKDVPITNYEYYKLEEMKPDIAYIHNPYDDCNRVTTVHPYYYSAELKKNARKLVYVPYFANAGFIAPDQQALPVCRNMDYMVVQSEAAKETCNQTHFYNKILPLGSPKFDKVIKKANSGLEIPEEWKWVIGGRKTLMLNTTINDLLVWGEKLIDKLRYFFELIKEESRVAIIWRPHPLLEATIKSMRPHLLDKYVELVSYFKHEEVGVFDLTGDVSNTVAIADGYVGSGYSSVINLFGVCGKPIYLFDNKFFEEVEPKTKKEICFQALTCFNGKVYGIPENLNGLLEVDDKCVKLLNNFQNDPQWLTPYWNMAECCGKLYFSPHRAMNTCEYDVANNSYAKLSDVGRALDVHFLKNVDAKNKVFFLPLNDFLMMEYDVHTCKWNYHTECMADLWDDDEFLPGMWRTCGSAAFGDFLWITTGHTNKVLRFNIIDGSYSVHSIGEKSRGYSGIVADAAGLWMVDGNSGELVRWIYGAKGVGVYGVPDAYECWKNVHGIMRTCVELIDMGKYFVTVPADANCMVRFDKESGESCLLVPEFWKNASEMVNGFVPRYVFTGGAGVRIDDTHLLVQRKCDCAMAKVDVINNTYEQFVPTLSDEDFDKLMAGEDGFEKAGKLDYFCRRESKIFTISGFIDDLVEGRLEDVRERQLEALSTLAANLDGTCGEKVHEYMMDVLESEEVQ